jgi:hypothetical protein
MILAGTSSGQTRQMARRGAIPGTSSGQTRQMAIIEGCESAVVEQNGRVKTSLLALLSHSAPGTVDALGPVVTAAPFGVGKSLAVMVAVFAFLLGAMSLGGLLGASRRRKGREKRH